MGHRRRVRYEVEGVAFAMGKTMQWLRDELQLIHAAPDSEWYAGQVPSTEGVYLVPAFTGLAAPTGIHTRARRSSESATPPTDFTSSGPRSSRWSIRPGMFRGGARRLALHFDELRIDGGAVKNNLLCQLLADILGIPVVRPKNTEATAFGAMLLAALSTGVYRTSTSWGPPGRQTAPSSPR